MNIKTRKLYYENQYLREFTANIIEEKEENNKYYIVLDKTAFFPGGGGQSSDLGTIDNIEVINIYEDGEKIIHVLNDKPSKKIVNCIIDWTRRVDGMQQHLAQHVISGCFFKLFNINTAGIHLGQDVSTIDLCGEITEEQIRKVEKRANEVIQEQHNVVFTITNREDAINMGLRRKLQTNDDTIRVVKIEGVDINACCGVHPNNTFDLRLIKIKGVEKHKGNSRIEFLAGMRAVKDYLNRDLILQNICNLLSAGADEAIKTINNLNDEVKNIKEENGKLKNLLSKYEAKELMESGIKINNISLIKKIYENEDVKYVSKLANRLIENRNTVALFFVKEISKVNLIFACSKDLTNLNMGNILKETIKLLDGKGGGNKFYAQGGAKNTNNLEKALEFSLEEVKKAL